MGVASIGNTRTHTTRVIRRKEKNVQADTQVRHIKTRDSSMENWKAPSFTSRNLLKPNLLKPTDDIPIAKPVVIQQTDSNSSTTIATSPMSKLSKFWRFDNIHMGTPNGGTAWFHKDI